MAEQSKQEYKTLWDHLEDVKKYLQDHEEDIFHGINDFGDLKGAFAAIVERQPTDTTAGE